MNLFLRIIILFFLFTVISFFSAQELKLNFSENITTSSEYKPSICFFQDNYYILVQEKIKSSSCDIKINTFDKSLKSSNQFDIKIDAHTFLSINQLFNKIILFTSTKKNNSTELYAHFFDIKNGFIKSKIIFSEPNISGYSTNYIVSDTTYEDEFFVLAELPFQSGQNEDIKLLFYDQSCKLTNQVYNKLEVPFESKRDNKLLISPIGKIILIKTFWKKGNNFYLYSLGTKTISQIEIKLNQRKIAAIDYFFNDKYELVIAGFFTSLARYNFEGYFIHKYDSDLSLFHKNQYYLSKNIIEGFKSSKSIKESGAGLDRFRVSDFSNDAKGSYYLMAEHLGRKKIKDVNQWNSKGMVVIKFNKNGNYVWGCPVPLKQTNEQIKFLGSFHLNKFNNAQYFYNSLDNLNLRKGIPSEYGSNNYCGTKVLTFSSVGLVEENIIKIDFPPIESNTYAFYPKQLNPFLFGKSVFSLINKGGNSLLLGVEK